MQFKMALYQSNILFGKPHVNLTKIEKQIEVAAQAGCELILVPELCLHGYDREAINSAKDFHLPAIQPHLQELTKRFGIALAGSFVEEDGGNIFNSMIFINSTGTVKQTYRKTHLFKKLNEDRYFRPGNSIQLLQTDWGKIGLAICYDLRFPEMFRAMMRSGAEGFLLCAEWPTARIQHWKTLLQARAIENQAWVAACNATGLTGKVEFGGASSIISPWGDTLTAGTDEELLISSIDLNHARQVRAENPFLMDYRDDILNINDVG